MNIKNMSLTKIILNSLLLSVLVSCDGGSGTLGETPPASEPTPPTSEPTPPASEPTPPTPTPPTPAPPAPVSPTPITSFEILDPTPGAGNGFGNRVIILGNGNIIVGDTGDSSVAVNNGAVHLFDPGKQTLLGSVYGDNDGDSLGASGGLNPITVLANNNYVVSSRFDDIGGIVDAASVRLISGETGMQIGVALSGDNSDDGFGFSKVIALANGNYVLFVQRDDIGGITDAGSVRLMNGTTGEQLGDVFVGDAAGDLNISGSVTALKNSNYVIAAPRDDINGVATDVGSVRLMDGATGMQIGAALMGDNPVDNLGLVITALLNSNYVVGSSNDAIDGFAAAGSAQLMNGMDATAIGPLLAGNNPNDKIGERVVALANSNYVVSSSTDNVAGVTLAGSVQLVNGVTGVPINPPLVGGSTDQFSFGGIIALANNNYVVISPRNRVGMMGDVGSVRLMNGSTGAQLGVVLGNNQGDQLGSSGVTELTNNNYVIRSPLDEINGVATTGSVRLVSGTAGTQIGAALVGDDAGDRLGTSEITILTNGNYVLSAPREDVNGVNNVGSVRLIDGATGAPIGSLLEGVTDAFRPVVTALENNNYVVVLHMDDTSGVATGSVQLMNGATGDRIGDTILGAATDAGLFSGDLFGAFTVGSATGSFYILAAPAWDNNGVNTGLVRLIAE